MSVELRPATLMSSLNSASDNLTSIREDTITSLRRSINMFVINNQLDSRGYNGLKSSMSEKFLPMLDNASNAIMDLLVANQNHKNALESVRQYPVLNLAQINSEIEQLEDTIRRLEQLPGMMESALVDPRRRLDQLKQKLIDFQTYLSASSGIYSASAGSLSQLDSALTFLELATFNVSRGQWTWPCLEDVETMVMYRDLTLEADKLLAELIVGDEYNWDLLEEIMNRPYAEIGEAEAVALAWIVTKLNSSGDYEGLERFVLMMMHQVDDIVSVDMMNKEGMPFPAWELDDGMLSVIIWGLTVISCDVMAEHMPLWNELQINYLIPGNRPPKELWNQHLDFEKQQNYILQSLGLMMFLHNMQTVNGVQFIGDFGATVPNFSISQTGNAITVSFSGVEEGHILSLGMEADGLNAPTGAHMAFDIHTVVSGGSATALISELIFAPTPGAGVAIGEIFGFILGEAVSSVGGIPGAAILSCLTAFVNYFAEVNENTSNHQVFLNTATAQDFGMNIIYITNHYNDNVVQQLALPSHQTSFWMNYHNTKLHYNQNADLANYNLAGDEITPIDFIKNPEVVLEIWQNYLRKD